MRIRTLNYLANKRHHTIPLDGIWKDVLGDPENSGAWLVFGREKNGKTWFSLKLAERLSQYRKTLFISGEEGLGKNFCDATKRANVKTDSKRLGFVEYTPLNEISELLKAKRSYKVVLLDNITVYQAELRGVKLKKLLNDHPGVLFVFIAHEERGEPYTAAAKLCRKLAKVIVRVQGLTAFVSGRCPGGKIVLDIEKSQLYHGTDPIETT